MTTRSPRNRSARALLAVLALALTATACQDLICLADPDEENLCKPPIDTLDENLAVSTPIRYASGVAYRVAAADRITLLHTNDGTAEVLHVTVPNNPTTLVARPSDDPARDRAELLVLSESDTSLTVIDTTTMKTRRYALGSPFPSMALSPDGRYAVLWYSPGSVSTSIVQNISEMAIIDLDAQPAADTNPQVITLRTFDGRPQWISFAPAFTMRGQSRRVALVMSNNYANLIELDNPNPEDPAVNETVVHFIQSATVASLRPLEVVWTPDPVEDDDMFAFILAEGSDDIISLNLLPAEELDVQSRPVIRPSLNQLTAGSRPVATALYDLNGVRKLISVNRGSRDIAVIDVATSDTAFVPYEGDFNDVIVFQAVNRDTGNEQPYAMLYNDQATSRTVTFVELATVESRGTRAMMPRVLPGAIQQLTLTQEGGKPRAVVLHPDRRSFSILDLERQAVAPLEVAAPIVDYTLVEDGQMVLTAYQSSEYISLTDLKSAHSTAVRLDTEGRSIFYIQATNSIVVDHAYDLGYATVLPYSTPTRERANTLRGFAADGLLSITE